MMHIWRIWMINEKMIDIIKFQNFLKTICFYAFNPVYWWEVVKLAAEMEISSDIGKNNKNIFFLNEYQPASWNMALKWAVICGWAKGWHCTGRLAVCALVHTVELVLRDHLWKCINVALFSAYRWTCPERPFMELNECTFTAWENLKPPIFNISCWIGHCLRCILHILQAFLPWPTST